MITGIVDSGVLGLAVVKGLVQVRELGRGVFAILINLLHGLESKSSTTSVASFVVVSECVFDKSLDEVRLLQILELLDISHLLLSLLEHFFESLGLLLTLFLASSSIST